MRTHELNEMPINSVLKCHEDIIFYSWQEMLEWIKVLSYYSADG